MKTPEIIDYLSAFDLMLAKSPEAIPAFEKINREHPQDPLAAFHLGRLTSGEPGANIVLPWK